MLYDIILVSRAVTAIFFDKLQIKKHFSGEMLGSYSFIGGMYLANVTIFLINIFIETIFASYF